MKQVLLLTVCFFLGTAAPVLADPTDDAAYIVEHHLRSIDYEKKLAAMSQTTLANLQSGLDRFGAAITDPDRFLDELLGDLEVEIVSSIRESTTAAFIDLLTPEELAVLAGFYRSEEGQALLAQGLSGIALTHSSASFREGPGAPILKHLPELTARTGQLTPEVARRLTDAFSMDRIADILEMDGIVRFNDESQRRPVVEAMRNAE